MGRVGLNLPPAVITDSLLVSDYPPKWNVGVCSCLAL